MGRRYQGSHAARAADAPSHQHLAQFSAEEMQAAVEEAHRWGLPITAHAHGTPGIKNAVAAAVSRVGLT